MKKIIQYILILALFIPAISSASENSDPLEGMNRAIYSFNEVVDGSILKPVAKGYKAIMPNLAVKGVNNFYNNLRDIVTVANDLLQLKIEHAAHDSGRVLVNSTVGILGLIDIHSMSGGERRKEDFGQTLGHYGIGHGAYLVLPFLGPSSLRDGVGLAADTIFFDPIGYVNDVQTRNQIRVVQLVDKRTELLIASDILGSASLDPYAFQRDAYFQYREALVNDKSTTEINYNDSANAGFEPYIDETVSNKPSNESHNDKVVLVN